MQLLRCVGLPVLLAAAAAGCSNETTRPEEYAAAPHGAATAAELLRHLADAMKSGRPSIILPYFDRSDGRGKHFSELMAGGAELAHDKDELLHRVIAKFGEDSGAKFQRIVSHQTHTFHELVDMIGHAQVTVDGNDALAQIAPTEQPWKLVRLEGVWLVRGPQGLDISDPKGAVEGVRKNRDFIDACRVLLESSRRAREFLVAVRSCQSEFAGRKRQRKSLNVPSDRFVLIWSGRDLVALKLESLAITNHCHQWYYQSDGSMDLTKSNVKFENTEEQCDADDGRKRKEAPAPIFVRCGPFLVECVSLNEMRYAVYFPNGRDVSMAITPWSDLRDVRFSHPRLLWRSAS